MSDKVVSVTLQANTTGFVSSVKRAEAAVQGFSAALGKGVRTPEFDKIGSTLTKVGALGVAAAGAAVAAFANFDQAMSNVAATGSDAQANMAALRAEAIKAGADTKFSASEAAQGIENLLKAGVSAKDVLGGGLSGALDLAAAGGQSVADAAETAATTMTQFNLKGSDMTHVADLLAAGAGKAMGDVSDLAMALKQGGLMASQAGLSVEETTGTLSAFAQAGLIGSDAGTSFKTMLQRLMNPSTEAAGVMKQLGINAYDSSGHFVSMSTLAGELKDKMGGLSESQRNAAMATIFGSDAIRAATVLYKDGSKGITGWTKAVDDNGYAAEVAQQKMNNLKGDIEQFKGSLETLMITAGSAGNGPLRSLVQQLTSLANFGSRHTTTTQSITMMVGALGGMALVAGGVMKATKAVVEFRDNVAAFNTSNVKLSNGIQSISKAAGVATLALGLTGAAVAGLTKAFGGVVEGSEAAESALKSLGKASGVSSAQMDKFFQDASGGWGSTDIVSGVNSLSTALERVSNSRSGWTKVGDNLSTVEKSLGLISNTQLDTVTAQFTKMDAALAGMDAGSAAEAFKKIADDASTAGMGTQQLLSLFPNYRAELQKTADTLGVTVSDDQFVQWMGGNVPVAIQQAVNAQKAAGKSTSELAGVMDSGAESASDYADAVTKAGNAALGVSGSQISFQKAIDDATESLKKNGKTLDISTEKGRANQSALDDIASSTLSLVSAQQKNGASTEEIVATQKRGYTAFMSTARAMGKSKEAANAAAKAYGLVPKKVSTTVSAPGATTAKKQADRVNTAVRAIPLNKRTSITANGTDAARANVNRVSAAIDRVPSKTVTIHTRADLSGANAAWAAWQRIQNKTVVLSTIERRSRASRGINQAKATGGLLSGPGTGTSDSIPLWASNGEYIVRAAAVRAVGVQTLDHINAQGYASGGVVSPSTVSMGTSSTSWIRAVIAAIVAVTNPLKSLAAASDDAAKKQKALTVANAATAKAKKARDAADKKESSAKAKVDSLKSAKKNTDAQYTSRIAAASKSRSALLAQQRSEDASYQKRIAAAQAGVSKARTASARKAAQRQVASLRAQKAANDKEQARELAANSKGGVAKLRAQKAAYDASQTKKITAATTAYTKAKTAATKAEDTYSKKLAASKAAQDASTESTNALKDAQNSLAASVRSTSDNVVSSGITGGSASSWLRNIQKTTQQTSKLTAELQQLRKMGLSEDVISQIEAQDPMAAQYIAQQIIAGGAKMVAQFNAAVKSLRAAGDNYGLFTNTAVKRATGGLVVGPGTGTSDSVHLAASNGEYVVNARATAMSRPLLDRINSGMVPRFQLGGSLGGSAAGMGQTTVYHNERIDVREAVSAAATAQAVAARQRLLLV